MAEETKEVEVKEEKPSTVKCTNPDCGKMIYNGEKCSCKVSKDKHDK